MEGYYQQGLCVDLSPVSYCSEGVLTLCMNFALTIVRNLLPVGWFTAWMKGNALASIALENLLSVVATRVVKFLRYLFSLYIYIFDRGLFENSVSELGYMKVL